MSNFINFDTNQVSLDAGLRLRTSQLTTLGDYKVLDSDKTLLLENAGTGTGTYGSNKYNMAVGANEWLVRQTKLFHHYFSGKSQMVELTFDNFHPEADVTKRIGYFSSSTSSPYTASLDGFWIESDGTTIRLKAERSGTSTLNVPIEDWFGYSNLGEYQDETRWENFTVIMFDFLWLGGAILRLWVKTNHGFILAHQFHYSGTSEDVFTLSPNQPVRYEIRSSGGTGSMRYICGHVSTEGSISESSMSSFADGNSSTISLGTAGTTYPIKAVRLKSTHRDILVLVNSIDAFLSSTNDTAVWSLQINPTVSSALSYSGVTDFAYEQANGNGTITVTSDGTLVAGGSLSSVRGGNAVITQLERNFLTQLSSTLDGTMTPLVLCVTPISGAVNVYGTVGIKQY